MSAILAIVCGSVVGFLLALLAGGGSVLAVPMLLYIVGIKDAHVAIGTSAVAVSLNAFANLLQHARARTVKWPCALVFGTTGVIGAAIGAAVGKNIDGQRLLFLFGLIMIAIAVAMLSPRTASGNPDVRITPGIAVRLVGTGLVTGLLAGFFGIGGGFLIVPALMLGSGMAMINAVGSSLLSVGLFGATTALSYTNSGLVNWPVAAQFVGGGLVGGYAGLRLGTILSRQRGMLGRIFSGVLIITAVYILYRSGKAIGWL
jgi:uncharacterized protein